MSQDANRPSTGDSWPGVTPPARWFLRAPAAQAAPAGAVSAAPLPRRRAGTSWPGQQPADDRADGGGTWYSQPGTGTAPAGPSQIAPVVAWTPALHGRPGGPGLPPRRAGADPGTARTAGVLSPWQSSLSLWSEAGIQWDQIPPDDRPGAVPGSDWEDHRAMTRVWTRPAGLASSPSGVSPARAGDTMLLESGPARRPRRAGRRGLVSRRAAAIAVPAIVLVTVAVVALALLTGHGPKPGRFAADQQGNRGAAAQTPLTTVGLGLYAGQQRRGVFQTFSRIAASGKTLVAIGSQVSDGLVRQQFFTSADGGASWRLAPVRAPGGQPPLGYPAARVAGGPGGWVAVGPQAIWTSPDGLSWTLTATHGIPLRPGDQMWVLNSAGRGFAAAGMTTAGGVSRAVLWTSRDGLTWQRRTAAQIGLAGPGETVQAISYITSRGDATVISGGVAGGGATYSGVWLSTDGGAAWTRVTVPADHGAGTSIAGLGFNGSGLVAVRPGRSASGDGDGVAYFSPDGRTWRYSATIGGSGGGWNPTLVKGSSYGFVVAGTSATGQIVAYTGGGTGTRWQPTAPLGAAAAETVAGATVGSGGAVIAIGSTAGDKVRQQPVFLEAGRTGTVRAIRLAAIPGAIVPELAVNGLAAAGGQQVAVGSADGYPAIWRKPPGGSWALVSPPQASAGTALRALTSVTHGPAGWLAVGAPGPVVMTSADGTTWQAAAGPGSIAGGLAGVAAVATAAGPAGYVIVGKLVAPGGACVADVWWSPDLDIWTRAHDVNDVTGSSQVLTVAAAGHGFVSAGSHNDRPTVWTTADGRSWTTIVLPLPPGSSSAVLQQIAIGGSHVAALGQATTASAGAVPFAEASSDGGASWYQVPFRSPGPATTFTALAAGPGGFTAVGQFGEPGHRQVAVWNSASGTAWVQSQIRGVTGAQAGGSYQITALAPAGAAVAGIGTIATQKSQAAFTVTLPGR